MEAWKSGSLLGQVLKLIITESNQAQQTEYTIGGWWIGDSELMGQCTYFSTGLYYYFIPKPVNHFSLRRRALELKGPENVTLMFYRTQDKRSEQYCIAHRSSGRV